MIKIVALNKISGGLSICITNNTDDVMHISDGKNYDIEICAEEITDADLKVPTTIDLDCEALRCIDICTIYKNFTSDFAEQIFDIVTSEMAFNEEYCEFISNQIMDISHNDPKLGYDLSNAVFTKTVDKINAHMEKITKYFESYKRQDSKPPESQKTERKVGICSTIPKPGLYYRYKEDISKCTILVDTLALKIEDCHSYEFFKFAKANDLSRLNPLCLVAGPIKEGSPIYRHKDDGHFAISID